MVEEKREKWGNKVQFILTCIGYAVGLGNIWRFPKVAFENGGGSFLIVYIIVTLLFGLPTLYLELNVGQFSRKGPAHAFGWVAPAFKGLGWAMILMSCYVCIYYNVIVAWSINYLVEICTGRFENIVNCGNSFNTDACCERSANAICSKAKSKFPADEYYYNYILRKTDKPDNFGPGPFVWPLFLSLLLAWLLVFLVLSKGMKILGKVSYVVCTLPYILIAILFGRGVSLDGAYVGMEFYLKPQWDKVLELATWKAALVQNCYSLSIAMGGLLTLASYNKRTNNVFRDAVIINFADGFMSVFGGIASFSILGHMASKLDREIEDVLVDGSGLAFIAYPTALGSLEGGVFFAIMLFLMLFLLGMSSMFGLAEAVISGINDTWPSTRPYRIHVTGISCTVMFLLGVIMTTYPGGFYLALYNDYSTSISLTGCTMIELILLAYIYGCTDFLRDVRSMIGNPNCFTRICGPTSYYMAIAWLFIAPIFGLVIMYAEFSGFFTFPWLANCNELEKSCKFEPHMYIMGSALALSPLIVVVSFMIYSFIISHRQHKSFGALFRPTEKWPAFTVTRRTYLHRTFLVPLIGEVPNPEPDVEEEEINEDINEIKQE